MDKPNNRQKSCSCKGIRTCLKCETNQITDFSFKKTYIYCDKCGNQAYDCKYFDDHYKKHVEINIDNIDDNDDQKMIRIEGIYLQKDVITDDEEINLIKQIDSFNWIDSQSGRRKQDFGPKINFKKKKINFQSFIGLPKLDVELLDKIRKERLIKHNNDSQKFLTLPFEQNDDHTILNRFYPIEICHLEYCPERGSSIDPHFDDNWIWGERLVTINLLSTTILTLTDPTLTSSDYCIRVMMPRKSILILYDDARYKYHHSIKRSDVTKRRLAITFRELAYQFFQQSYIDNDLNNLHIYNEFINRSKKLIDYKI